MNTTKLMVASLALTMSTLAVAQVSPAHYTTTDTTLATLAADPAAKAIIDKDYPGLVTDDVVSMAGTMTLKSMQQFKPEFFTDAKLKQTDAELAQLPVKK